MKISKFGAERIAALIEKVLTQAEAGSWKKPWVSRAAAYFPCRNIERPQPYQGVNAGLLSLVMSVNGYRTPLFITGDKARDLGLSIKKDSNGRKEECWPVFKWLHFIYDKDGNKLNQAQFEELSLKEQGECTQWWSLRLYFVYNIDQTTMQEDLPSTYEKFCSLYPRHTEQLTPEEDAEDPSLDYLLNTQGAWRCPILHQVGNQAFYQHSYDYKIELIQLPKREQFKTISSYYGTALHEMAHSTKGEPNMRRNYGRKKKYDEGYALEELVAEFTAAFVCCERGHTKTIDSEHVAYVQMWRKAIKKHDVVTTILDDLIRCVNYTLKVLNAVDEKLSSSTQAA